MHFADQTMYFMPSRIVNPLPNMAYPSILGHATLFDIDISSIWHGINYLVGTVADQQLVVAETND
jgi:hypothetical protein